PRRRFPWLRALPLPCACAVSPGQVSGRVLTGVGMSCHCNRAISPRRGGKKVNPGYVDAVCFGADQCINQAPSGRAMAMQPQSFDLWHGTTVLTVRKGGAVVIGGDGQVSIGQTIVKANAKKVRRLAKGDVIGGFAGA